MAIYLGFGFSIGIQILIARRNGEGRYGEIGNILNHGISFLLLLALIIFAFADTTSSLVSDLIGENKGKDEIMGICKRSIQLAYAIGIPF